MAGLIAFALAAYAAWFVFAESELPLWSDIRDYAMSRSKTFAKLCMCPVCSGFWVSLALSTVIPVGGLTHMYGAGASAVLHGLFGAASIFLIEVHVKRLEER